MGAAAQVSETEVMGSRDRVGEPGKEMVSQEEGTNPVGFYPECSEDHWKAASTDEMESHS